MIILLRLIVSMSKVMNQKIVISNILQPIIILMIRLLITVFIIKQIQEVLVLILKEFQIKLMKKALVYNLDV